MRNLLVVDGRGGHKQAGESGHSGVDRAPFTKAARLTILHRIAGHEEWRDLGRKSVVIRFRPLRSWGVQISLGCSRWRRGKISKAPRSWPSKEPANKFDGNYLIVIDRRDESYPTPGYDYPRFSTEIDVWRPLCTCLTHFPRSVQIERDES